MTDSENVDTHTLTRQLELLKLGARESVTKELLKRADIRVVADHIWNRFDVSMRAMVLADRVLEDMTQVPFRTEASATFDYVGFYWKWRVIPWRRRQTVTTNVEFSGRVQVLAEYFRLFPEAGPRYYPDDMGAARRHVRLTVKDIAVDG